MANKKNKIRKKSVLISKRKTGKENFMKRKQLSEQRKRMESSLDLGKNEIASVESPEGVQEMPPSYAELQNVMPMTVVKDDNAQTCNFEHTPTATTEKECNDNDTLSNILEYASEQMSQKQCQEKNALPYIVEGPSEAMGPNYFQDYNEESQTCSLTTEARGPYYLQDDDEETQTCSTPTEVRNLPIIARVYLYLEKEYEYMKSLNGDNCDLSPLADILKRTAEATGTSEENVTTILKAEDLSHHLPKRAKKKRKKTHEDNFEVNSKYLTEDHDMLQDDNDIKIEEETIGYAVYGHEPKPTGSNDNCETLDTSRTQVKVRLNDDETMSTNRLFLEVSPLDRTSKCVKSVTPGAEETEVKLEDEDDPLRSTPNDFLSTLRAADVTVKLEPQDDNCR